MLKPAMARRPREQVAGGVYHVFARGNDRGLIFRDDVDCRTYLRLLAATVRRVAWRLLAYCLMGNHMHLLVETPQPNLAEGMQWLHGHYGRRFNDRHGRAGHVFQGRYKAVRQRTDEQLLGTLRYVARNPVAAGLAATPAEYRWSSHRGTLRGGEPTVNTARVYELLGARDPADGPARYAELIGEEAPRKAAETRRPPAARRR